MHPAHAAEHTRHHAIHAVHAHPVIEHVQLLLLVLLLRLLLLLLLLLEELLLLVGRGRLLSTLSSAELLLSTDELLLVRVELLLVRAGVWTRRNHAHSSESRRELTRTVIHAVIRVSSEEGARLALSKCEIHAIVVQAVEPTHTQAVEPIHVHAVEPIHAVHVHAAVETHADTVQNGRGGDGAVERCGGVERGGGRLCATRARNAASLCTATD